MRKIFNFNFMKYFKFFFILFICSFLNNNAYADCFGNVKFGDNLENVKKKELGVAVLSRTQRNTINYFIELSKACPEQNLGRVEIILKFKRKEEKLFSKTISVVNVSPQNLESKKKLLFNYVIKNYGSFKGSDKIDNYDGFHHWKNNGVDFVYIRELNPNGYINEELTIFDRKYN